MVNLTQKLTSLIWSYWLYGQFSLDKTADHITDLHCTLFFVTIPKCEILQWSLYTKHVPYPKDPFFSSTSQYPPKLS